VRWAVLTLLAACAAPALGCQESGFDERKETVRPLKVQHVLGESKVPGQAEQPVTLSVESLDDTLALGVRPLAASVAGGVLPPYLRARARDVPLLENGAPPPDDADLIIASAPQSEAEFLDLSKIAPTVVIDEGGSQWKLNLRLAGEALGRTNDAEALLTRYDRDVASVRADLPPDSKVALSGAGRDSFAGSLLADAGVDLVSADAADATLENPVWSGPGGALAAQAALADLKRILQQ
jgi:iron complex transport system substrate-binding protein